MLGVSAKAFAKTGALNGFADVDSRLHVDPHLLTASRSPELHGARAAFEGHFHDVVRLLGSSRRQDDAMWREAVRRLTFPEVPVTALGYAKAGIRGSGIGRTLAAAIATLGTEIIEAGIRDPEIFELVGLLQEGVGADRISDMTIVIILAHLLAFTARAAKQVGVHGQEFYYKGTVFRIPYADGRPIVLVPRDILRDLPVAESWSDIDTVAAHNAALRERVNPIIGRTWRTATGRRVTKAELRATLLRHPELLQELIERYRSKPAEPYDVEGDPEFLLKWFDAAKDLADSSPLHLQGNDLQTRDGIRTVVRRIVLRFGELIESNRLSRILYNDDGTARREKVAQLLFYGLAVCYCEANDLDLTPEADAGAGPVDFKISRGARHRVVVEVKLSSNRRLVHGLERQLPAYQDAERTQDGIYLVIRNGEHKARLRDLERARQAVVSAGKSPEVLVVDGRLRVSASRRR